MKNFLSDFPDERQLLKAYPEMGILRVNGHIHTPYSFSAFEGIPQIFEMARNEKMSVVGINDFYTTRGYEPFCREALKSNIFPLFNIEYIGLMKAEQQQNIRVNDPNNPGRCYFSGKGLDYPFRVDRRLNRKLAAVVDETQQQIRAMIDRANKWFQECGTEIRLNYDTIRKTMAKEMVRERHIAKAIRIAVYDRCGTHAERNDLLTAIFEGRSPQAALTDIPAIENEIRASLLKSGGRAFVEEDDRAFLSIDEIIEIIVNAGGIPCYPVLLDDKNGNYTEYEKDPEYLWKELTRMNIRCIELIPGRNDAVHLERFAVFFHDKGYVILMGTEHNTPEMFPLTCDTRGKFPLSPQMQRISYEGACVVAAHQYLRVQHQNGFGTEGRLNGNDGVESFVKLGNAVIHYYLQQNKIDP